MPELILTDLTADQIREVAAFVEDGNFDHLNTVTPVVEYGGVGAPDRLVGFEPRCEGDG